MKQLPSSADVVVVGGGVIGLTTAVELARAGAKVCLLDRGVTGREASWAGGGILSPLPPDQPVPEIKTLLEESLALYPNYCAELRDTTGIDPEYWVCGASVQDEGGERWFPEVAQVRNPRLVKALRLALLQQGVCVLEHLPALAWRQTAGKLTGVITASGVIACTHAVLAAGAWSGQMAEVGIRPIKGQMLLLRSRAGALDHIRMDNQAYLVPRRDGRVLVGSTLEDAGFDKASTQQARDFLLAHALKLWRGSAGLEVEGHWTGLRPCPAGPAPFIGPTDGPRGLFANTGHHRLGLTLSLASARRSAAQIIASAMGNN